MERTIKRVNLAAIQRAPKQKRVAAYAPGIEWERRYASFPVGTSELLQQIDSENARLGLRWRLCG